MSMRAEFDNDISEVYSPPRVSLRAGRHGLRGGWALDRLLYDDDGVPWDFYNPAMREKARRLFAEKRQKLIIGSPVCTPFSALQAMNRDKFLIPEQKRKEMEPAIKHLRFCISLYRELCSGRFLRP